MAGPGEDEAAALAHSGAQKDGEAVVNAFRQQLGPFVVAAQKTRMPMVFTNEAPGHRVIFANDAFLSLTGYARDEVLGKSFQSLLADGTDAQTIATVEAAFRGECDHEPEIHYKRKNDTEFWASMFVSPVCDESGTVVQQFVSLVDLTKHRRDRARCRRRVDRADFFDRKVRWRMFDAATAGRAPPIPGAPHHDGVAWVSAFCQGIAELAQACCDQRAACDQQDPYAQAQADRRADLRAHEVRHHR